MNGIAITTTSLGAVIQAASLFQETGNNWYKATAEWTELSRKLAYLERQHDFWSVKLTEFGMLSDISLTETLREAEKCLREEQAKHSRRRSRYRAILWSKASRSIFPAQIGQSIQRVIDALDAIPGQLSMEQEATMTVDNRVMRRALSLVIKRDYCYVPIKASESRVYSALDDAQGPQIVLLYGLPRAGKSALARRTALHYHNTAKRGRRLFTRVVLLECGREADLLTTQIDLLQRLSPTLAASLERERGENSSVATIPARLSSFLKDQKLLIILDDVWKGEFLQKMVALFGAAVRCLVTSQRGDLCLGFNSEATRILIEDAEPATAMEMLRSHVGFRDRKIPLHIQEVAEKIVKKTQGHPLALALLGTAIDYDRSDDLDEWEDVCLNYLHVLGNSEGPVSVLGDRYKKSFSSTMQLSMNS